MRLVAFSFFLLEEAFVCGLFFLLEEGQFQGDILVLWEVLVLFFLRLRVLVHLLLNVSCKRAS